MAWLTRNGAIATVRLATSRDAVGSILRAWTISAAIIAAAATAGQASSYLGPCAAVASKDGKTLYVANADARQVAWIELPGGKVVRRNAVPGEPTGLVLSPDGTRLIVTCAAPKSTVLVIDAVSGKTLATMPAGHTAMGPAISPDGKRLYVCNRFNDDVSVIDLQGSKEVARVRAVREPVAAAVTPDGKAVYVANHQAADPATEYPISPLVTVIESQTHQTAAIRLPHGSHSVRSLCISPDGKYVYAAHVLCNFELTPTRVDMGWMNINVVSVIDTQKKKVLNSLGLDDMYMAAGNPWGVATTADGKSICVTHAGTHELSVVDASAVLGNLVQMFMSPFVGAIADDPGQGSRLRRIKLSGKGPRGLAVVGSTVYVAQYFSDTVAVADLKAAADDPVESIALGPAPQLTAERRGELLFNDATI